jgi:hypothetical protein
MERPRSRMTNVSLSRLYRANTLELPPKMTCIEYLKHLLCISWDSLADTSLGGKFSLVPTKYIIENYKSI